MVAPLDRDRSRAALVQNCRFVRGWCLAELAMVVAIWVMVPLVLRGPREPGTDGRLLALIFYAVGLGDVAFGLWLKRLALARGRYTGARSYEEIVGGLTGQSLIAVVTAVTPAVLGIAHFAMYVDRGVLSVLSVLCLIGLALSWPSLDRWQEILEETRIERSAM
ncbi:MAG: hypothetical protein FJX73_08820 [Armatimonadetes bacterium]|nr:hypothetical protein [Armatimonadota bacterium]